MDVLLVKTLEGLRPVDDEGTELLRGIKRGEFVKATIKRPRNVRHHRLFFALMKLLFENQSRYGSLTELVAAIKCAVGHCDIIHRSDGYEIRIPKSISFASMDQAEFRAFWDRVCDLACSRIVPGLNRADLEREILEMVNG